MTPEPRAEVHAHFDKLLQCNTVQRAAYLKKLRQESSDLAEQVSQLMADLNEAEAEAFLNTNEVASDPLVLPQTIRSYTVIDVLGRGGMGTVYLARQTVGTKRLVAIKLVHSSGNGDSLLRRFEREKQLLAFLDHRHITKLYEVGTTAHGEPFFVMEYVKGLPIDAFCDQNRYTIDQRLRLFSEVCEAIAHAHQKGIIHRDLKPGNVLVKWEQGVAVPKIIDFGVARVMQISIGRTIASHATIVGTPAYMSPEQCLGKADIDTRSDVYSLGALLHQILVDQTPHEAKVGKRRQVLDEVLLPPSKILNPARPDDHGIAELRETTVPRLNQKLKGDLDQVCLKALATEPSQRYQTVWELVRDIQCFLEHRPISAMAPSVGYRFKRFVRRNRSAVVAGALVCFAVVAGFLATSAALWRANAANDQARLAANLAKEEAEKAKAAFTALQTILASPDPFIERRDIRVSELLARFPEVISESMLDEETKAALQFTIGRTYSNMGDPESASPHFQRAIELQACVYGPDHKTTLATEILLTRVISEQGFFPQAMARSQDVFQRAILNYEEDEPVVIESLINLVSNYLEGREYQKAQRLADSTLPLAVDLYGPSDPKTAMLLNFNGQAALYLREFTIADPYFESAHALSVEGLGETHPQTLEILHNLILAKVNMGHAKEYLATTADFLARQEKIRGKNHPYTLGAVALLAHVQLGAGAFSAARETVWQLLDRGEEVFEPGHPRLAYCYQYLGKAAYAARHWEEALVFLECALAIEEEVFGENSPRVAASLYNRGLIKMALPLGLPSAEATFRRADKIFSQEKNFAGRYFTLQALSHVYQNQGEEEQLDRVLATIAELDFQDKTWRPLSNMIVDGLTWD